MAAGADEELIPLAPSERPPAAWVERMLSVVCSTLLATPAVVDAVRARRVGREEVAVELLRVTSRLVLAPEAEEQMMDALDGPAGERLWQALLAAADADGKTAASEDASEDASVDAAAAAPREVPATESHVYGPAALGEARLGLFRRFLAETSSLSLAPVEKYERALLRLRSLAQIARVDAALVLCAGLGDALAALRVEFKRSPMLVQRAGVARALGLAASVAALVAGAESAAHGALARQIVSLRVALFVSLTELACLLDAPAELAAVYPPLHRAVSVALLTGAPPQELLRGLVRAVYGRVFVGGVAPSDAVYAHPLVLLPLAGALLGAAAPPDARAAAASADAGFAPRLLALARVSVLVFAGGRANELAAFLPLPAAVGTVHSRLVGGWAAVFDALPHPPTCYAGLCVRPDSPHFFATVLDAAAPLELRQLVERADAAAEGGQAHP